MDQLDLAKKVVEILESLGFPYMFVGSYGSGAWGEPRFTYDIDVVIELSRDDVEKFAHGFQEPEYYVSVEAIAAAIRLGRQFNVIHPSSGNKIDFIVSGRDEWDRTQLSRRRRLALPAGLTANVASPEDIIISKMRYYRQGGSEKHLRDIAGILKVSSELVDRVYVARWAEEFGVTEIWHAILRRLGERPA